MYINGSSYNHPFSVFGEVSRPGYGWTTFHYARWNIIRFIFEYLISNNHLNIMLRLKSADGRCSLLCLLKSNGLKLDIKRDTFDKIISN